MTGLLSSWFAKQVTAIAVFTSLTIIKKLLVFSIGVGQSVDNNYPNQTEQNIDAVISYLRDIYYQDVDDKYTIVYT